MGSRIGRMVLLLAVVRAGSTVAGTPTLGELRGLAANGTYPLFMLDGRTLSSESPPTIVLGQVQLVVGGRQQVMAASGVDVPATTAVSQALFDLPILDTHALQGRPFPNTAGPCARVHSLLSPGRLCFVEIWAPYCTKCRASLKVLAEMKREHPDAAFDVVSLCHCDDEGAWRAAQRSLKLDGLEGWTDVSLPEEGIPRSLRFGGSVWASYLLDSEGTVLHSLIGPSLIRPVLAESLAQAR